MTLSVNSQIISDPDKKMLQAKYASPQVGTLDPSERLTWSKVLLLKIHVITGWTIEKEMTPILVDQFSKKLLEDYPHLNADEIEYAFRKSGTVVVDWGKAMNLSLIDEVLIPYSNERARISADEEKKNFVPPPQKTLTQAQLDDVHREDAENFYQRIRNGWIPTAIPNYIREIMKKDGIIADVKEADLFFTYCLGNGKEHIYQKVK